MKLQIKPFLFGESQGGGNGYMVGFVGLTKELTVTGILDISGAKDSMQVDKGEYKGEVEEDLIIKEGIVDCPFNTPLDQSSSGRFELVFLVKLPRIVPPSFEFFEVKKREERVQMAFLRYWLHCDIIVSHSGLKQKLSAKTIVTFPVLNSSNLIKVIRAYLPNINHDQDSADTKEKKNVSVEPIDSPSIILQTLSSVEKSSFGYLVGGWRLNICINSNVFCPGQLLGFTFYISLPSLKISEEPCIARGYAHIQILVRESYRLLNNQAALKFKDFTIYESSEDTIGAFSTPQNAFLSIPYDINPSVRFHDLIIYHEILIKCTIPHSPLKVPDIVSQFTNSITNEQIQSFAIRGKKNSNSHNNSLVSNSISNKTHDQCVKSLAIKIVPFTFRDLEHVVKKRKFLPKAVREAFPSELEDLLSKLNLNSEPRNNNNHLSSSGSVPSNMPPAMAKSASQGPFFENSNSGNSRILSSSIQSDNLRFRNESVPAVPSGMGDWGKPALSATGSSRFGIISVSTPTIVAPKTQPGETILSKLLAKKSKMRSSKEAIENDKKVMVETRTVSSSGKFGIISRKNQE